ncbi:hypothetical protein ACM61V_18425 [Sphingomonas sp. TX0543]|uniref:Uncharacterized protein n=1 Tax=Edaphosphingomonas fennica TaxID=114404 RepID=A0A2T4I553_9SPHN|nr:hypothetical protein [Sphingomonas fennica]PTD24793.1 hypothetical protein CV103_07210 [Sphingomonas fennica]
MAGKNFTSLRKPAPDEAQIRVNPETGKAYIFVERPKVMSLPTASPEEIAEIVEALRNAPPTSEPADRNDIGE